MESMFSADFFVGNRQRLKELFTGKAPIVITANGMLQRGGDNTFPFQQDASFWYLTGLDQPDLVLVIDKNKEYLIVPERSYVQEVFDGALEEDELRRRSGITTVLNKKNGWRQLGQRLKKANHVATLNVQPAYIQSHGFYVNPARRHLVEKLKELKPDIELLDLHSHLARLRIIKQPEELAAIQAAVDLTAAAIKYAARKLAKLRYEYEVEAEIVRQFLNHGADDAWKPIIAAGQNACVIHAQTNRGALSADELVLIDVGAFVQHYAADISRTLAISGKPSRRQQLVYEAVKTAQDYAFGLLKPGVMLKDYEKQVEQFIGEKLRELNVIKTIESAIVRKHFPHAVSHFLGLDVHDVGDYDRPLEPGMVLTVEPGIYIPEEAIGVRIEDDVLITKDGIEVMSKRLSRELA